MKDGLKESYLRHNKNKKPWEGKNNPIIIMPTGYTAGILDGKITTFPQFAKTCMRAFGAAIHMRDDDMDKPYEKRTPSDYHDKELIQARRLRREAKSLSDDEIISRRKEENRKSIEYHKSRIVESEKNEIKLKEILAEVVQFNPPTKAHEEFKNFMADQIRKTIDFDCGTKYHDEALEKLNAETFNPKVIRAEMIAKADKDITYHSKERAEEIKRCEDANKWVDDLILSLEE
jgi:hypothetical protein